MADHLSVCLTVPDPILGMEGHSKVKIDRKEAHYTGDPWLHLEVERSNVKITSSLNAMTESQPYLQNRNAYELQTWYIDGLQYGILEFNFPLDTV